MVCSNRLVTVNSEKNLKRTFRHAQPLDQNADGSHVYVSCKYDNDIFQSQNSNFKALAKKKTEGN